MLSQIKPASQDQNKFIDTRGSVRLVGCWSWITGILGFGYAVVVGLIILLGIPYGYDMLTKTCESTCFNYGQLSTTNVVDLQNIGISIDAYAIIYLTVLGIFTLVCLGTGTLMLWRKPGELLPFCAAYFIFSLPSITGVFSIFGNFVQDFPALYMIYLIFTVPGNIFTYFLLLTFPTGKFKGKVFFWFFLALTLDYLLNFAYSILFGPPTDDGPSVFNLGFSLPLTVLTTVILFCFEKTYTLKTIVKYLGFILLCVALVLFEFDFNLSGLIVFFAFIYRYNKVLTSRERNAAKWIIWSNSIFLITTLVLSTIVPSLSALQAPGTYYFLIFNYIGFVICSINETGLLIAVFYANAFDINLVIKRTIVYSALTVVIVGIYIGSVVGLQAIVRAITGQQNDLAIVGATLVSIILFQPIRKAIQRFVDRRFYRSKYDAARTIAELNAYLKTEMDLKTLSVSLQGVLNETLQPELVTVWFKKKA